MCIGDMMKPFKSVNDPPEPPEIILPPIPKVFAIKLGNLYYTENSPYPWTADVRQAKTWADRAAPDKIISNWKTLDYHRIDKRGLINHACLGGQRMATADVEDVTELRTLVSDLWEYFS
jgi:hypothetical protein